MNVSETSFSGLQGASDLYFVAQHFDSGLIVLPPTTDLFEAKETLEFFLSDQPSASSRILVFPHFENLYSPVKQDPFIVATRLETQSRLALDRSKVFVLTNFEALSQKTATPANFEKFIIHISKSQWIERDSLVSQLKDSGYRQDALAEDKGFFSVRGNLVDVFLYSHERPFRIEFFGDEIVSIRDFDADTQRSLSDRDSLTISPRSEMLFHFSDWPSIRERIRSFSNEQAFDPLERDRLLTDLENRFEPLEPRWILPGLMTETGSLIDYLPPKTPLVTVDEEASLKGLQLSQKQEDKRQADIKQLHYSAELLRFDVSSALQAPHCRLYKELKPDSVVYDVSTHETLRLKLREKKNFSPLLDSLHSFVESDFKTSIVLHNAKRETALRSSVDTWPSIDWKRGPLFPGFSSPTFRKAIINERDIFGTRRSLSSRQRALSSSEDFLRQFSDLKGGDFVIHEDHGIARFLGLQKLNLMGFEGEFLVLEYLNADKLYVPVYRFDKVTRYVSEGQASPRLDRLGSQDFLKRRSKIKNDIFKIAHELLEIAAQRRLKEVARSISFDHEAYQAFCSGFPYDLTIDQENAIDAIEGDFQKPFPMDRLICGDVGFGKTEVALRAAMITALHGKQVAVLAPTTLLVEQHYKNFQARFSAVGIPVARLSRFVSPKDVKETLQSLDSGHLRVVIGTHRLLQTDIVFKQLGLIVIDEEQRFGVKHKERLKKFRSDIDVLTLSATPIPRTLQMSMVGIRDLSLIASPPENREEVRTFVGTYDEALIKNAILKELGRGGQILVVHNRVKSIAGVADRIQRLVPDVPLVVAHGQLPEDDLENRMMAFVSQKAKILVATSIIENGLDIPSANTLIVDHAELFGLSELYQLRGRVGRSHLNAFAYFLVHETTELTPDASKRLQVIATHTALGSGFKISTHDMEIRGAGNLLGDAQSGIVAEVGLELYTQMLEETLNELRNHKSQEALPEMNAGFPAFIPESYIPDIVVRISTYKQINSLRSLSELMNFESELLDRFGLYSEPLENLCGLMQLRILAHHLHASHIDLYPGRLQLTFRNTTPLEPSKLVRILSKSVTLDPKGRLSFGYPSSWATDGKVDKDIKICRDFLKQLLDLAGITLEYET